MKLLEEPVFRAYVLAVKNVLDGQSSEGLDRTAENCLEAYIALKSKQGTLCVNSKTILEVVSSINDLTSFVKQYDTNRKELGLLIERLTKNSGSVYCPPVGVEALAKNTLALERVLSEFGEQEDDYDPRH